MVLNIEVEKVTIITSKGGADDVILTLRNIKTGCWPYSGQATLQTKAARGHGEAWVRENFGSEISIEIIHV